MSPCVFMALRVYIHSFRSFKMSNQTHSSGRQLVRMIEPIIYNYPFQSKIAKYVQLIILQKQNILAVFA